jgi:predicted regulator of Ras-like GTPase activity (Roadblock/LC7/MglB family)
MPKIEPGLSLPAELDADRVAAITMEVAATSNRAAGRLDGFSCQLISSTRSG